MGTYCRILRGPGGQDAVVAAKVLSDEVRTWAVVQALTLEAMAWVILPSSDSLLSRQHISVIACAVEEPMGGHQRDAGRTPGMEYCKPLGVLKHEKEQAR